MLRRIAGEDDRDHDPRAGASGSEESKGGGGGGGGGVGSVVGSAQLLDAVNDILGRADLSLSAEQGTRLKESLRHKGNNGRGALSVAQCSRLLVGLYLSQCIDLVGEMLNVLLVADVFVGYKWHAVEGRFLLHGTIQRATASRRQHLARAGPKTHTRRVCCLVDYSTIFPPISNNNSRRSYSVRPPRD